MHGSVLEGAFDAISDKDTGERTGSKLFNSLLDYYSSWLGRDADRTRRAAALLQADPPRAQPVPWTPSRASAAARRSSSHGGANQPLTGVGLIDLDSLQRVHSDSHTQFSIPDLRPAPALISRLPAPRLQNALRLGFGHLDVSWNTAWTSPPPANTDAGLSVTRGSRSPTCFRTAAGTASGRSTRSDLRTINCTGRPRPDRRGHVRGELEPGRALHELAGTRRGRRPRHGCGRSTTATTTPRFAPGARPTPTASVDTEPGAPARRGRWATCSAPTGC